MCQVRLRVAARTGTEMVAVAESGIFGIEPSRIETVLLQYSGELFSRSYSIVKFQARLLSGVSPLEPFQPLPNPPLAPGGMPGSLVPLHCREFLTLSAKWTLFQRSPFFSTSRGREGSVGLGLQRSANFFAKCTASSAEFASQKASPN
jgi:hypothetical protein